MRIMQSRHYLTWQENTDYTIASCRPFILIAVVALICTCCFCQFIADDTLVPKIFVFLKFFAENAYMHYYWRYSLCSFKGYFFNCWCYLFYSFIVLLLLTLFFVLLPRPKFLTAIVASFIKLLFYVFFVMFRSYFHSKIKE